MRQKNPNFQARDYDPDCHCDPEYVVGIPMNDVTLVPTINEFVEDVYTVIRVFHIVRHPDPTVNETVNPSSNAPIDEMFIGGLIDELDATFTSGTSIIRSFRKSKPAIENPRDSSSKIVFDLYPNPAGDFLVVEMLEKRDISMGNLVIVDAFGSLVMEIPWQENQERATISIDGIPDGVYLLGLAGTGTAFQRLVILR